MKLVLKISGEILNPNNLDKCGNELALFIKSLISDNNKVAIVIGGGNYFRGRSHTDMNERDRDTIGMLASIMNSLYIHNYLEKNNVLSSVLTPFSFNELIPVFSDDEMINKYNNNVLIFGGGIGKCGYSTDTKCFEVAHNLNADYIIKLTNVDGIYNKDPNKHDDALLIKSITYNEVLDNKLNIMDLNMIEACKINNIKIKIINYKDKDKIFDDSVGSIIGE